MLNYEIKPLLEEDMFEVYLLIKLTFKDTFFNSKSLGKSIFYYGHSDLGLKMVIDNKIIGCHIIFDNKLYHIHYENFNIKKEQKGIEGFLFCIHPDYQRKGYGSAFINFEKEYFKNKYEYIWGGQDGRLNNSGFWSKHRKVINDGTNFTSLMLL